MATNSAVFNNLILTYKHNSNERSIREQKYNSSKDFFNEFSSMLSISNFLDETLPVEIVLMTLINTDTKMTLLK